MLQERMRAAETRRRALLDEMAEHVLRHGLGNASLRRLAAAAGTSDRMLLYYFADKDELVTALLAHLAARLRDRLEAGGGSGAAKPFSLLLTEIWGAIRDPDLQPYLKLWIELAGRAARGEEPHRAVAGQIADGLLAWAGARLETEAGEHGPARAALLVATLEGLALLDAVGRTGLADLAVDWG
jgi:AcrR family transcriptional regulator